MTPARGTSASSEALELGRTVLRAEAHALAGLADRLDDSFGRAVGLLLARKGKVVASGVGKSGLVARRIAATLTSTGTPTVWLHPVDALHGDVGLVEPGDVALVVSKSGAGDELEPLLPLLARLGCPVIALTAHADSPLARAAQVAIAFGPVEEAGPLPEVPTTSALVSQALGDALASALAAARGFEPRDFQFLHPGGVLGRRALLTVREVMHGGDAMPQVAPDDALRAALLVIMEKRLGLTTVVGSDGALLGVLTDGDLKRILLARGTDGFFETRVHEVMHRAPRTIGPDALVASAVRHMEDDPPGPITALVVVDEAARPIGVLHLHDCLRLGLR
jgi:arabinose-5-phosphate isomerase